MPIPTDIELFHDFDKITFTCNLHAEMNNGILKKKMNNLPTKWQQITDNKFNFNTHNSFCVITGEINNYTVIDCDKDKKTGKCSFQQIIDDFPFFKEYCLIVETQSGGFHIYCDYNNTLKTTTNVSDYYPLVDIRNDGGCVISPGSVVVGPDNKIIGRYKVYSNPEFDNVEMPLEFLDRLKPSAFKTQERVLTLDRNESNEDLETLKQEVSKALECFPQNHFRTCEYTPWRDMMFAIKNTLSETGWELFEVFSKKCSEYENHSLSNIDLWMNYQPTNGPNSFGIGSIKKWAYEADSFKYQQLFHPVDFGNIDDIDASGNTISHLDKAVPVAEMTPKVEPKVELITLDIICKSENDIAKFIAKFLKPFLVYSSECWFINDKTTFLWRHIKEPHTTVINTIQMKIDEARSVLLQIKSKTEDAEKREIRKIR